VALVCGLLFTLGVFTALLRAVDRPFDTPDPKKIVDVFSQPLRPRPPQPPPLRPTHLDPPKLIPQPGPGTGIHVADPPLNRTPPRRELRGTRRFQAPRAGLPTSGIDREPMPIVRIDPISPPRAIATNTEGWVQVQFTISAAGTVKDATVVAAEPRGVFEDAA